MAFSKKKKKKEAIWKRNNRSFKMAYPFYCPKPIQNTKPLILSKS